MNIPVSECCGATVTNHQGYTPKKFNDLEKQTQEMIKAIKSGFTECNSCRKPCTTKEYVPSH